LHEGVADTQCASYFLAFMFAINPQGVLIYDGAIDDKPTPDLSDVPGATNYVSLALEQAMAGKPVQISTTRPYGCSVKYADSTH
jgi:hypothetical protein